MMGQKPITKKQMRWKVSLEVASLALGCLAIWLNRTGIERILAAILPVVSVGSIFHTVMQWKKHPLVDEEVDRELQEEKKNFLTAMGGILLIFSFAIFMLILAIRAF